MPPQRLKGSMAQGLKGSMAQRLKGSKAQRLIGVVGVPILRTATEAFTICR